MKMMKTTTPLLSALLFILLAAAPARAEEECPWIEGKIAPQLTADGGIVRFRASYHPSWFRCAKKAGGKLVMRVFTGSGGKHKLLRTREIRSYSLSDSVGHRDLCGQDPPENEVKVTLDGTGVMEKLTYKSDVVSIFCARCQWRGDDNMLAVMYGRRGKIKMTGKVDPEWHSCAKEDSTLEMHFFTGESREDVKNAKEPTFVLKGFEKKNKWKRSFPRKKLCKEGVQYAGYEWKGTGEMSVMNDRNGRQIQELHCP